MTFVGEILSVISQFIISIVETSGYTGVVFLMALESACVPIPSEVIMPFAGFLVSKGTFGFWWVVLAGSVGNLIGSLIAFWIGKYGGRPLVLRWGRYLLIHKRDLDAADRWFKKYGSFSIFFSRLLPVIRTFISLPAGIAKMDLSKFVVFTFLGAIPFNWLLTFIGFELGENWESIKNYFHGLDVVIGAIIVLGIVWWIWKHIKNTKND